MSTTYQIFGNYRGVVVDNADPLKQNRVRIRVHGFFDGVADNHLPWAAAAFPLMGGSGAGFGWFGVPAIRSMVFCFFEQGDYNQPVYFAEAPDGIHGHPSIADTNYPDRRGFQTSSGHILYFDDKANVIQLQHSSGAKIQIDSSGNVTITGNTVNINP